MEVWGREGAYFGSEWVGDRWMDRRMDHGEVRRGRTFFYLNALRIRGWIGNGRVTHFGSE